MSATYVLIPKAAELYGYTPKAIERKIETSHWREGVEWNKAPDGRIFIIIEGVNRWIEQGPPASK